MSDKSDLHQQSMVLAASATQAHRLSALSGVAPVVPLAFEIVLDISMDLVGF